MCLSLLLREKVMVQKKRRGKRWWTSLQEQCPRSPETPSYLKSMFKFVQLLAAGQCELIWRIFSFQISGVLAGGGMLCCLGAGGQEPAEGTGSLEACLTQSVSITLISGNSGVRWVWCAGRALLWTVCLVLLLLYCQDGAQHSGVPLGRAVTRVRSCWATQGCPAAVVVSPSCSKLWCPNISLPVHPRISSLTATLHMHSRKKKKGKRPQRGQGPFKKIQKPSTRRTTKTQRRRLTGKMGRDQD